jgi:hypothetical protein
VWAVNGNFLKSQNTNLSNKATTNAKFPASEKAFVTSIAGADLNLWFLHLFARVNLTEKYETTILLLFIAMLCGSNCGRFVASQ